MEEIKIEAFKYALSIIQEGFVFEKFAQSFLTAVTGYNFMPVGGVKDKGIDGLEYIKKRNGFSKQIYQFSTEKDIKGKIENTIDSLRKNKISFDILIYATNREVKNKEQLIDGFIDKEKVFLRIYDLSWFVLHANYSNGTRAAFFTFVESNLHEYSKPGKAFAVSSMDKDSRLFVFLRQQLESKRWDLKIDKVLADTLILFSLEGTDPDKGIVKTSEEIKDQIKEYVKFDPKIIEKTIDERLLELSKKPRKIKLHKIGYCLPYETRLEIAQRNLSDAQLQDDFYKQCSQTILKYLNDKDAQVKNLVLLINDTIHKIFYQQGLEFSNFILHGKSEDSIEKDLRDTIGIVVDQSSVIEKNKEIVKTCLLMAIRDIVYNGTIEQKKYFQSLSNTYMMMFMLQWNPQIALYFESMASRLNIYVCTSIIIPALSEYYLDEQNRRHWNLLMSAKEAGVKLYITDAIIDELVSHFYMIKNKYESIFKEDEEYYLLNDIDSLYIDEIMIRAYFHAKFRGNVYSFQDFINNFCSPYLINTKEELVDFLKNQFDIQYTTDEYLNVKINTEEHERLSSELEVLKKNANKAQTDAEVILTIYKLRERANEASQTGIYGYKTWWLSKDTSTYRVVEKLFVKKYPVSCYMRPDFLYNYITLAPKKFEVDNMYKQLFPSLIGINLSFHMPREISEYIQQEIKEHGSKNPARMKAIIRQLTDRLKSDPNCRNRRYVEHFLDQQRKTLFQHQ